MFDGLIGLIVLVIVVGIVVYILRLLINKIPMDEDFKQIAWLLIILAAVLLVVARVLPMLGLHSPV